MSQQRPYEGFSYPTEFQGGTAGGGGDTYFATARSTPPSATSPASGVSNTGLTRRTAQHAGSSNGAAAATNGNASPTGAGPVTVPVSAVSPSGAPFQGSYGYFHSHGNSIDVNSGYNSDAGSSVSNSRYMLVGGSYSMTGASPRMQDAVIVGAGEATAAASATDVSPTHPPPVPRFTRAQHGYAVPGAVGVSGAPLSSSMTAQTPGSGGGVFHTGGSDGRAGSVAESTRSNGSSRPPAAPPTFLPSRPFVQTPLSSANHPHHPPSSLQPYMVPMPSSTQGGHGGSDPLGGTALPGASGPRMPVMSSSDVAHGYGSGGSNGAAAGGAFSRGFFGRLLAQVLPPLDDDTAATPAAQGSGGGSLPRERPLHQIRFGNPEDDLPLLEELGIFPRHILDKARAVLNPFKTISLEAAKDTDLAGPILFALSLAILLSLRGKIQFSAIYGLFVLGVGFFKVLLSLMQPKGGRAPLQFVVSTVGYGLLPTVLLAVVRTTCSWLLTRRSLLPVALLMIVWSAGCGSAMVAKGLGMEEQRYLVLYPMLLFYAAFDALTVF